MKLIPPFLIVIRRERSELICSTNVKKLGQFYLNFAKHYSAAFCLTCMMWGKLQYWRKGVE